MVGIGVAFEHLESPSLMNCFRWEHYQFGADAKTALSSPQLMRDSVHITIFPFCWGRDVLYICMGVAQSIAKGTDFAERCRPCFSSPSEHRCRTKTTLVHLTLAFETLAFGPSSIDGSLGTCGLLYLMANSFSFYVAC